MVIRLSVGPLVCCQLSGGVVAGGVVAGGVVAGGIEEADDALAVLLPSPQATREIKIYKDIRIFLIMVFLSFNFCR